MTTLRRLALIALLGLASSATTGCYHAVVRGGPVSAMPEQSRTGWNLFWGIADATFDLSDCPNGVAKAEVWDPWWGIFPRLFTLGILSPQRLNYICAAMPGMAQAARSVVVHQYAPPPERVQLDSTDEDDVPAAPVRPARTMARRAR